MRAIWEYVARHQADAANKLIKEIVKKFSTLRDHPHIGRQRDELLVNLRSLVVRNYVIFYQPVEDGIEVLRVIHGSRDIDTLFERFFDSL